MTTDFIHGRPMKQIVLFSLPIMLSSLLQYTYNMVDNIIVGRYVSTNALAAVGNIAPISSFAIGAAFGLTAGFTIPVAQCFGAGDQEETNRQAGNGIGLSLITGVLFSALALLVLHPMLGWIHVSGCAGTAALQCVYRYCPQRWGQQKAPVVFADQRGC